MKTSYEVLTQEKGRKRWITLEIHIEEGKKYIAGDVNITGNYIFSKEELKPLLTMRSGDTFTENALHGEVAAI